MPTKKAPGSTTSKAAADFKVPKPFLKEGVIYYADNGRLICLNCAGMSAKFTGRDISGQKVTAAARVETLTWHEDVGEPLACEGGCTTYPLPEAGAPCYGIAASSGAFLPGETLAPLLAVSLTVDDAWDMAAKANRKPRAFLEAHGLFSVAIRQETALEFCKSRKRMNIRVNRVSREQPAQQI